MATYYVSKDGDDGNAGTSLAAAFRNLAAAYTASSDDDTILFDDGTFTDDEIELSADAGYALLGAKSLTIGAVNPGSVTINAAVTTATFRWSTDMSGKSVTITGLAFDVEGGAATNYHIWWRNTGSSKGALTVTNCAFADAAIAQISCTNAAERVDLTVTNCTSTAAAGKTTRSLVNIPTLTSGDIVITDNTCTILNQNSVQGTVYVKAVASGPTFLAERNTFNQTQNTSAGSFLFPVVSVYNIDGATVQDSTINGTSTGASAAGALVVLDCDSATLTAHYNVIRNVRGTVDFGDSGYALLIGHDTTGSDGDDRCNYGVIEDCDVSGSAAFVSGGGHGIMLGNNTGGIQRRNKASVFAIGMLQKGTTGAKGYANIIEDCELSYLQHKGSSDSYFCNNTIFLGSDYSGGGYVANVNDGPDPVVNNSGNIVKNNAFVARGDTDSKFIGVGSSQDAELDYNAYKTANSPASPIFSVQGSDYTSVAAYLAAQELHGKNDVAGLNAKGVPSPLSDLIRAGTAWNDDDTIDFAGNYFEVFPTIGAYHQLPSI